MIFCRYTPKPYFTAPTSNVPSALASPLSRGSFNPSPSAATNRPVSAVPRSAGAFNADTWQNQRTQFNYGYNRNFSYARAAQSPSRQTGPVSTPRGNGAVSDAKGNKSFILIASLFSSKSASSRI